MGGKVPEHCFFHIDLHSWLQPKWWTSSRTEKIYISGTFWLNLTELWKVSSGSHQAVAPEERTIDQFTSSSNLVVGTQFPFGDKKYHSFRLRVNLLPMAMVSIVLVNEMSLPPTILIHPSPNCHFIPKIYYFLAIGSGRLNKDVSHVSIIGCSIDL